MTEVPREQTNRYGILKIGKDDGRLVEVTGLVEKPEPEDAPSNLSIIGRYVLLPEVIEHLARMERGAGNEVQLTDGMARMIGHTPFHGLRYEGRRFDCGDKIGFLEAQIAFALKRPDMAADVRGLPQDLHLNESVSMAFTHQFRPDRSCANTTSAASSGAPCIRRTPSPSAACFGSVVAQGGGKTVAVGYDGRLSCPELEPPLVEGLKASGMEVLRIGRGPTPMLYFAATTLKTDGAVMVTGSHNPPDYNGFKMMLGRKAVLRRRRSRRSAGWRRAATWCPRRPAATARWTWPRTTSPACSRTGTAATGRSEWSGTTATVRRARCCASCLASLPGEHTC